MRSYFKKWLSRYRLQKKYPCPPPPLPYNQKIKEIQNTFLISLLIFLLFGGLYFSKYLEQKKIEASLVNVVVLKKDLTFPATLSLEDITLRLRKKGTLPQNYFSDPAEVVGQTLVQNVFKNEVLLASDIQNLTDSSATSHKFSQNFAFTLEEKWLEGPFPKLSRNDLVDIIAVNPKGKITDSLILASGVSLIEVGKKQITLNVTQEAAQSILFARGLSLPIQLLVHSQIKSQ